MRNIVVHRELLTKCYSTRKLSITHLIVIVCNLSCVILPFYFWMGPDGGFWSTQGSYREQPDVSFLYKFIMVLEAASTTGDETKEIFVSTMDSLNVLRPESFRTAHIQFHEEDSDFDGVVDRFNLEASVPLNEDEEIKRMQVVAFFNVRLRKKVKLDMESLVYAVVDSDLPMSGYDTDGSLLFRQAEPLGVRGYASTLYAEETPLVNTESEAVYRASNSNVGNILEKYRIRDVGADYVERYPIKSRLDRDTSSSSYRLKMKIRIPQQTITYIPPLMEVLKDAWVKYFSFYVLCWLLLERIKTFAFSRHLL